MSPKGRRRTRNGGHRRSDTPRTLPMHPLWRAPYEPPIEAFRTIPDTTDWGFAKPYLGLHRVHAWATYHDPVDGPDAFDVYLTAPPIDEYLWRASDIRWRRRPQRTSRQITRRDSRYWRDVRTTDTLNAAIRQALANHTYTPRPITGTTRSILFAMQHKRARRLEPVPQKEPDMIRLREFIDPNTGRPLTQFGVAALSHRSEYGPISVNTVRHLLEGGNVTLAATLRCCLALQDALALAGCDVTLRDIVKGNMPPLPASEAQPEAPTWPPPKTDPREPR